MFTCVGCILAGPHLADLKAKNFFKVGRLADEQQVEGPAPAEVRHNDGVDGHGGEEVSPGGFKFLSQTEKNKQISLLTSHLKVSMFIIHLLNFKHCLSTTWPTYV